MFLERGFSLKASASSLFVLIPNCLATENCSLKYWRRLLSSKVCVLTIVSNCLLRLSNLRVFWISIAFANLLTFFIDVLCMLRIVCAIAFLNRLVPSEASCHSNSKRYWRFLLIGGDNLNDFASPINALCLPIPSYSFKVSFIKSFFL